MVQHAAAASLRSHSADCFVVRRSACARPLTTPLQLQTGAAECLDTPAGSMIDFEGAYCLPYPEAPFTTCDMVWLLWPSVRQLPLTSDCDAMHAHGHQMALITSECVPA